MAVHKDKVIIITIGARPTMLAQTIFPTVCYEYRIGKRLIVCAVVQLTDTKALCQINSLPFP